MPQEMIEKLNLLPSRYLNEITDFVEFIFYKYERESVNEETQQAIEEIRKLRCDKNKKIYASFSEILEEVKVDA